MNLIFFIICLNIYFNMWFLVFLIKYQSECADVLSNVLGNFVSLISCLLIFMCLSATFFSWFECLHFAAGLWHTLSAVSCVHFVCLNFMDILWRHYFMILWSKYHQKKESHRDLEVVLKHAWKQLLNSGISSRLPQLDGSWCFWWYDDMMSHFETKTKCTK